MSNEWQPIETAPKDGTAILLFEPTEDRGFGVATGAGRFDYLCIGVARWFETDDASDYWADAFDLTELMDKPTHWMPLPKPPKEKAT